MNPDPKPIQVISSQDRSRFESEFLKTKTPVLLEGFCKDWSAFGKWSPEFFRDQYGDTEVTVTTPPPELYDQDTQTHLEGLSGWSQKKTKLGEYADHLLACPDTKAYLEAMDVRGVLPDLNQDIEIPEYIPREKLWVYSLWMGPKGTTTTLHYDVPHNTLVQISGSKEITLYAPDDWSSLYPLPLFSKQYPTSSRVNLKAPDLNRYPKFKNAVAYKGTLEAGNALFLPGCWWHEVHNATPTIAVNYWWWPPLNGWDMAMLYLGIRGIVGTHTSNLRKKLSRK